MSNPWIARFTSAPALVAPESRDEFESALVALSSHQDLAVLASTRAAAEGDDFWTELGPRLTPIYRPYVVREGVLHLPVRGVLLHDFPYQFGAWATGYEYIWKCFERGMTDPEVRGIAQIIKSPGGEVAGNFDLVDRQYAMRGIKPIRSFAAEHAYSAAYSIASVADKLIVARTGGVGSIGVVTSHVDASKMMDDFGWKITFIFAGKHKVDGNPYEALPADVKARIQERVDGLYGVFVDTVARNRNLDAAAVRATEAMTFTATEAIENGLADSVGSLESALAEFAADLANPVTEDETMTDTKTATVASVKTDNPDVANALIAEGKEAGKAEAKAGEKVAIDAAVKADRERIAAIDALAKPYAGNAKVAEMIAAAKADGGTAADTALKIMQSGEATKVAVLGAIQQDDATATGAKPAAPGGTTEVAQTPDGWKAEFEGSADLQKEWGSVDLYVAHKKDEQRQKGGAK